MSHDPVARGLSLAELARMTELVAAAREALGGGVDLAIDCHGIYHVRDVILLAQRLEPFDLVFLEDPVPPENVDALAKVTRSTPIPICTGEWLYWSCPTTPTRWRGAGSCCAACRSWSAAAASRCRKGRAWAN